MTEELSNPEQPTNPVGISLTDRLTMRLTPDGDRIVARYTQKQFPPTPISDEERAYLTPDITKNPDGTVTMPLKIFALVMGSGLGLYPNSIEEGSMTIIPTTQENPTDE